MSFILEFVKSKRCMRIYLIFLAFFWTFKYWETLWRRIGFEDPQTPNIIMLLALALGCKQIWNRQINYKDLLFYIGVAAAFLMSSFFYPASSILIEENKYRFLVCTLPFYFVGLIFNYSDNREWVVLFSYIAAIINIVYMFFMGNSTGNDLEELMRRSYILLPSLLIIVWNYIEKRKKIDLIFSLLCFLLISGYGSRGPFVCLLFFLAIYFIFFKEWKHPYFARSIILSSAYLLYSLTEYFAMFMISVVSSVGLSTRIFESILNDAFLNYQVSNGRNEIQDELLRRIDINKGHGFGLYTDRNVTEGYYAHNFFVEIWYDFGYVIGTFLSLCFLLLVCYSIRKNTNQSSRLFIVAMFSAYFMQLMFSSSYLQSTGFFFLIGFCVQSIRREKVRKC